VAFGLPGGTAVKAPIRELFQGWKAVEILDEGFATKIWNGLIPVEPYVFQFVFRHGFKQGDSFNRFAATAGLRACWMPFRGICASLAATIDKGRRLSANSRFFWRIVSILT
jgi:hypothetical protein